MTAIQVTKIQLTAIQIMAIQVMARGLARPLPLSRGGLGLSRQNLAANLLPSFWVKRLAAKFACKVKRAGLFGSFNGWVI